MPNKAVTKRQLQRLAVKAANDIRSDITDRQGIGNEYEGSDPEIQKEMRHSWAGSILAVLEEAVGLVTTIVD